MAAGQATDENEFKAALSKLASDPEYREKAQEQPELIEQDFGLDIKELQALRQVAVMSGADVRMVDALRGERILGRAKSAELAAIDIDVSCCSCCCCCCGETAVLAV